MNPTKGKHVPPDTSLIPPIPQLIRDALNAHPLKQVRATFEIERGGTYFKGTFYFPSRWIRLRKKTVASAMFPALERQRRYVPMYPWDQAETSPMRFLLLLKTAKLFCMLKSAEARYLCMMSMSFTGVVVILVLDTEGLMFLPFEPKKPS